MARARRHNIILVGFMGTGKSSIGRLLAHRLGRRYVDTDADIEEMAGVPIPEYFAAHGEAAFRDLETEVVRRVSRRGDCVVSTGGGVLGREENITLLQEAGVLICLRASPDVILARTAPWEGRPMLKTAKNPRAAVEKLLAEREAGYALADWTIDSSDLAKHQVVDQICAELPSLYRVAATRS